MTAEQIYSATKVLRILVEHYFPFNDAIAEEMPYEQLPDFVESERPINRPEIRKAMLYIEKKSEQTSVAQKDFGTYSFKRVLLL